VKAEEPVEKPKTETLVEEVKAVPAKTEPA